MGRRERERERERKREREGGELGGDIVKRLNIHNYIGRIFPSDCFYKFDTPLLSTLFMTVTRAIVFFDTNVHWLFPLVDQ